MEKKKIALDVVNPQAAGIDVGSRSHYVAIGQGDDEVKEFGVYNEDLLLLAQWLLGNEIKTVAMESTGDPVDAHSHRCTAVCRRVSSHRRLP